MSILSFIGRLWPASAPVATQDELALVSAMSDLIMGKATVADAIAIVQFAWGIAVDVNPGLRALSSAESVAVALAPLIAAGIASGAIHSGASGEGQTAASDQTHGRYQGQ